MRSTLETVNVIFAVATTLNSLFHINSQALEQLCTNKDLKELMIDWPKARGVLLEAPKEIFQLVLRHSTLDGVSQKEYRVAPACYVQT